jgi:trehalose-phosphatase
VPRRLLARLEHELARGAGLVAILDYDGTLTPIVASPRSAALAPSVRATLGRLAASKRARLAILSGRALADVRARVGVAGVIYGGCHGLEIEGGGLSFHHPRVRASRVAAVRRRLTAGAACIPGAHVEFKGLALSLHYRNVVESRRGEVRSLAARVVRSAPDLRIIPGRAVFDFVPRVGWNKGRAVRWIARHVARALGSTRPLVLYAGDDVTDEAAFAALRGRGVTVRVGNGPSVADYHVAGVREMHSLLRRMAVALG